jgi:hypothetical protein
MLFPEDFNFFARNKLLQPACSVLSWIAAPVCSSNCVTGASAIEHDDGEHILISNRKVAHLDKSLFRDFVQRALVFSRFGNHTSLWLFE